MSNYKYAVALTGNIGSGKSTVCSFFKMYGFEIVDADVMARDSLNELSLEVVGIFGGRAIDSRGEVDRAYIRSVIFEDSDKREDLENLLHPRVRMKIRERAIALDAKKTPYIVDIPLYFETKSYDIDYVVVVYAPREQMIDRASKRDGRSKESVEKILDAQMDIEKKKELADEVIDNSGDINHLQKEVERVVKNIKARFA
ncbi:MAG: dephospho-CoA kinase [Campylobacterales bacterium]